MTNEDEEDGLSAKRARAVAADASDDAIPGSSRTFSAAVLSGSSTDDKHTVNRPISVNVTLNNSEGFGKSMAANRDASPLADVAAPVYPTDDDEDDEMILRQLRDEPSCENVCYHQPRRRGCRRLSPAAVTATSALAPSSSFSATTDTNGAVSDRGMECLSAKAKALLIRLSADARHNYLNEPVSPPGVSNNGGGHGSAGGKSGNCGVGNGGGAGGASANRRGGLANCRRATSNLLAGASGRTGGGGSGAGGLLTSRGRNLLAVAIRAGDLETVRFLVDTLGVDPRDSGVPNHNFVMTAIHHGKPDIVEYLLGKLGGVAGLEESAQEPVANGGGVDRAAVADGARPDGPGSTWRCWLAMQPPASSGAIDGPSHKSHMCLNEANTHPENKTKDGFYKEGDNSQISEGENIILRVLDVLVAHGGRPLRAATAADMFDAVTLTPMPTSWRTTGSRRTAGLGGSGTGRRAGGAVSHSRERARRRRQRGVTDHYDDEDDSEDNESREARRAEELRARADHVPMQVRALFRAGVAYVSQQLSRCALRAAAARGYARCVELFLTGRLHTPEQAATALELLQVGRQRVERLLQLPVSALTESEDDSVISDDDVDDNNGETCENGQTSVDLPSDRIAACRSGDAESLGEAKWCLEAIESAICGRRRDNFVCFSSEQQVCVSSPPQLYLEYFRRAQEIRDANGLQRPTDMADEGCFSSFEHIERLERELAAGQPLRFLTECYALVLANELEPFLVDDVFDLYDGETWFFRYLTSFTDVIDMFGTIEPVQRNHLGAGFQRALGRLAQTLKPTWLEVLDIFAALRTLDLGASEDCQRFLNRLSLASLREELSQAPPVAPTLLLSYMADVMLISPSFGKLRKIVGCLLNMGARVDFTIEDYVDAEELIWPVDGNVLCDHDHDDDDDINLDDEEGDDDFDNEDQGGPGRLVAGRIAAAIAVARDVPDGDVGVQLENVLEVLRAPERVWRHVDDLGRVFEWPPPRLEQLMFHHPPVPQLHHHHPPRDHWPLRHDFAGVGDDRVGLPNLPAGLREQLLDVAVEAAGHALADAAVDLRPAQDVLVRFFEHIPFIDVGDFARGGIHALPFRIAGGDREHRRGRRPRRNGADHNNGGRREEDAQVLGAVANPNHNSDNADDENDWEDVDDDADDEDEWEDVEDDSENNATDADGDQRPERAEGGAAAAADSPQPAPVARPEVAAGRLGEQPNIAAQPAAAGARDVANRENVVPVNVAAEANDADDVGQVAAGTNQELTTLLRLLRSTWRRPFRPILDRAMAVACCELDAGNHASMRKHRRWLRSCGRLQVPRLECLAARSCTPDTWSRLPKPLFLLAAKHRPKSVHEINLV